MVTRGKDEQPVRYRCLSLSGILRALRKSPHPDIEETPQLRVIDAPSSDDGGDETNPGVDDDS